MADVWLNMFHNLQQENALMKEKYNELLQIVREVVETIKYDTKRSVENERLKKKSRIRCKFLNKGFCKKGSSCDFAHPEEDCQEHCSSGSCPQERICPYRHPNKCQFWISGNCWRGPSCVYLHKNEDLNCVELDATCENVRDVSKDDKKDENNEDGNVENDDNEDETNDDSDVGKDDNEDENNIDIDVDKDANDDALKVYNRNTNTTEYVAKALSTEEIIKMYENVEFDISKATISTDDILKMYDTDKVDEKSPKLMKSTRKPKNKKKH